MDVEGDVVILEDARLNASSSKSKDTTKQRQSNEIKSYKIDQQ